jgi:sigma-B regulation protein RsbU (phosphoserine phosphatase)
VHDLADAWIVIVGDVTGKGVDAAALTALARHTVRTASEFRSSPAELLALLDAKLKKRPTLSVCTAVCIRLDGDAVTLAVGGHPLPLRVDSDGVQELGAHGPLLGAFADSRWQDFAIRLSPGDTLVAYTDGITDAHGEDEGRFGLWRLRETLAQLGDAPATVVIDGLRRRLEEFRTGSHNDDTAAIALRWRIPGGRAADARGKTTVSLHDGKLTTLV